ncbi:MAG: nitrate reductase molybdenum cofactor assembly chaperone [Deltaproteobacteria bacterium]|nr:nitrate reductase molybdenum cofactor assembly chaperone [Deltaproteobacteria bacterium]
MNHNPTDSLQVLSVLLLYPDDDLLNRLGEIASIADQSHSVEIKSAIQAYIHHLKAHTPIHVQERYTAVFDMNPATTMNMTYHAYGDNENRAAALAHLQHNYEQAGWERITGELPDYLPMMLEFLSICPHPEHTAPVWQCLRGMQPLIERLKKNEPIYAALLQPVVNMAVERCASVDNRDHPHEANE